MPAWDRPAVEAARRRLRLGVDPRRRRLGSGTRLGHGPGASLEFHDHRSYAPGDDLRHLDWRVYARSDQLLVRRFRREVAPRVEVLLDCSASMGCDPAKSRLASSLAALLVCLGEAAGARPRLWCLGAGVRSCSSDGWRDELERQELAGAAGLEQRVTALAAGAERFLVSDGLCPAGGPGVVQRLGRDAGRLCLVQVLGAEEREPVAQGPVRLEDSEGAGARDLFHDEAACRDYRSRLARHLAGWEAALRGRGSGVVDCAVEAGLDGAVSALLRRGAVEVAQ